MAKTDCCRNCVYGHWDGGLWMRTLWSGFPAGPMCANHPDTPGIMREVPGRPCRNYRRRPPDPAADAKTIILTNGMVAYVDACDYEELSKYTWQLVSAGYAARHEKGKWIFMHRQIMNPPPGMQVDHIHGNRQDNTRAHLRIYTASENARNRGKRADAASRYLGVTYDKRRKKKKWIALIRLDGRLTWIGSYVEEEEAARAYDLAVVQHFGQYVRLNFPEEWPPERRAEVHAAFQAAKREVEKRAKTAGKRGRRSKGRKTVSGKSRATSDKGRATKRGKKPRRATGHETRATGSKGSHAEAQGRGEAGGRKKMRG